MIDTSILALVFLVAVTLLEMYASAKKILLLELVAFVVMLPGVVWAMLIMGDAWFIPLLFVLFDSVLFVLDVNGSRR